MDEVSAVGRDFDRAVGLEAGCAFGRCYREVSLLLVEADVAGIRTAGLPGLAAQLSGEKTYAPDFAPIPESGNRLFCAVGSGEGGGQRCLLGGVVVARSAFKGLFEAAVPRNRRCQGGPGHQQKANGCRPTQTNGEETGETDDHGGIHKA